MLLWGWMRVSLDPVGASFLPAHTLLTDFMAAAKPTSLGGSERLQTWLISAHIWSLPFFFNKTEKHSYHVWRQSSASEVLDVSQSAPKLSLYLFLIFGDFSLGGELWAMCQATTAPSRTPLKHSVLSYSPTHVSKPRRLCGHRTFLHLRWKKIRKLWVRFIEKV